LEEALEAAVAVELELTPNPRILNPKDLNPKTLIPETLKP
jgi:hypothetical protein